MSSSNSRVNDRPVIAILAQEVKNMEAAPNLTSFISASYVKYVESGGARVVPIPTTMDETSIRDLFMCVNGLLVPGGAASLPNSNFYKNAQLFLELAVEANNKGDYFPIWCICLGFEAIPMMVCGTRDIMTSCKSVDVALPLDFTPLAQQSRLFQNIPPSLYSIMASENVTYNWHKFGFKPEIFESNEHLRNFFNVLSVNVDETGEQFVSTYEAKDYPIYGLMWHPEKIPFEFKTSKQMNIPHTSNAVKTTQFTANFFVDEARKSLHSFPSTEMEEKFLIYHQTPLRPDDRMPNYKAMYEQMYFF